MPDAPDQLRSHPSEGGQPWPLEALLWAIGCLVGGVIVGSILAGLAEAAGDGPHGAGTLALGEVGLWAGMAAAAVVTTRRYGTGSPVRDLGYRLGARDVWPGLGVAALALGVAAVLGVAFNGSRFAGTNTQIITGQKDHHGVAFAIVAVIVAVGAPAFEELFFRGVVRRSLSFLGPNGAVWGQAVLFGLAHYQPSAGLKNVSICVIVGSLGVVCGYAARFLGRLGPGMVGHGLFNAIQIAVALNS